MCKNACIKYNKWFKLQKANSNLLTRVIAKHLGMVSLRFLSNQFIALGFFVTGIYYKCVF